MANVVEAVYENGGLKPTVLLGRDRNAALPSSIEVVDSAMAIILRKKTEAERLQIAWGMWRSARLMLVNFMTAEHPDWDDAAVKRAVARRMSHGAI